MFAGRIPAGGACLNGNYLGGSHWWQFAEVIT